MKMTHIYPEEASGQNKSVKQCIFINFSPLCPFVSSSLHIYICMYMCMYMCVYIYVYVFVCVCVCVCVYYHNGFVVTHALGHMMFDFGKYESKCMSCRKAM